MVEENEKKQLKNSMTAFGKAMKAFHKGHFDKAEELLAAFLETHPPNNELVDRANLYLTICRNKKTQKPVSLKTADDYYQFGVYKVNGGDYEEAFALLEKAWRMDPKQGKIPYMMSLASLGQKKSDEALDFLEKAVAIDLFFKILAQNEADFEDRRGNERFETLVE